MLPNHYHSRCHIARPRSCLLAARFGAEANDHWWKSARDDGRQGNSRDEVGQLANDRIEDEEDECQPIGLTSTHDRSYLRIEKYSTIEIPSHCVRLLLAEDLSG